MRNWRRVILLVQRNTGQGLASVTNRRI